MMLILDDHPVARCGLSSILQMYRPDETILQASTIQEAMRLVQNPDVNLAFIDLKLGAESGFDFLYWIRDMKKPIKTFLITASSRPGDFRQAKEMGVDAYVLKDAFLDEIIFGLKVVERGGKFYSSALFESNDDDLNAGEQQLLTLTEREMDVLALLSQGYATPKISEILCISNTTTKKHISNILGKLDLCNRIEAILFATRHMNLLAGHLRRFGILLEGSGCRL